MSVVGGFPGLNQRVRMPMRAPINPIDKSTIVSIYPREITETKATMEPGTFTIPPGSIEKPSILVIGPSSWWKEIDEEQPLLEIPVNSVQVADSIVRDYCVGLLGSDSTSAGPGLFFVPGEKSLTEIKTEYKTLLEKAVIRQRKWFQNLVNIADMLWARTNGNPLTISDDARMGAHYLNLNEKPWIRDFTTVQMVNCKACGSLVNPMYPVCANCKAIVNDEAAKAAGIKFAT